jgi:hypothetical protein
MPGRRIRVEKLSIRIAHCSPGQARALAEGLGREILHRLVECTASQRGARSIGEVSIGKVTAHGYDEVQALQGQIAGRVAAALQKKSE